jgi:hypothetical protein
MGEEGRRKEEVRRKEEGGRRKEEEGRRKGKKMKGPFQHHKLQNIVHG